MDRLSSWLVGFGRFWYHFIVGDDWTMAAAVLIGLILTAILNANHLAGWWLIPLTVIVMLAVSLRRASR
jgi:hypothetical protein